jgi:TolB-like protein
MQLIDTASDTHVLSATYRRDGGDALQFQNYAAVQIAEAIRAAIAA